MAFRKKIRVNPLAIVSLYTDTYMRDTLKAARKASGLTIAQLADRLTVHKSTVSRIEAGKGAVSWYRYIPKYFAWMRACGVTVNISFTIDQGEFTPILPDSENIE